MQHSCCVLYQALPLNATPMLRFLWVALQRGPVHIETQLRCCDPRGATSCGSPMPRAEQIANPTERDLRVVGFFIASAPPIHHLTEAGTMFKRMLVLGPAALLAAACGTDRPHPTGVPVASTATMAFSAVKFWETGATVGWNELATDLAVAAPAPGINATRLYAYVALAQFRAAEAAQAAPGPHPPIAAAIGGASVAVLSSFFPSASTQLEAALDAQQASDPWPGATHADFAAGEAIGRAVGAGAHLRAGRPRWAHESSGPARGTATGRTRLLDLHASSPNRTRQPRRASFLSHVPGSAAAASAARIWKPCLQCGAGRGASVLGHSHPGAARHRELLERKPVAEVHLLLGASVRDLTNLGQRRIEGRASKCGRRRRPQLILGREKEGTRAEVAARD